MSFIITFIIIVFLAKSNYKARKGLHRCTVLAFSKTIFHAEKCVRRSPKWKTFPRSSNRSRVQRSLSVVGGAIPRVNLTTTAIALIKKRAPRFLEGTLRPLTCPTATERPTFTLMTMAGRRVRHRFLAGRAASERTCTTTRRESESTCTSN